MIHRSDGVVELLRLGEALLQREADRIELKRGMNQTSRIPIKVEHRSIGLTLRRRPPRTWSAIRRQELIRSAQNRHKLVIEDWIRPSELVTEKRTEEPSLQLFL